MNTDTLSHVSTSVVGAASAVAAIEPTQTNVILAVIGLITQIIVLFKRKKAKNV